MEINITDRMTQILDSKALAVMEAVIENAESWTSIKNTLEDGEALAALGIDDQEAVEDAHSFAVIEEKKYIQLEIDLKESAESCIAEHFLTSLIALMWEVRHDLTVFDYDQSITNAFSDMSDEDEENLLNECLKACSTTDKDIFFACVEIMKFKSKPSPYDSDEDYSLDQ